MIQSPHDEAVAGPRPSPHDAEPLAEIDARMAPGHEGGDKQRDNNICGCSEWLIRAEERSIGVVDNGEAAEHAYRSEGEGGWEASANPERRCQDRDKHT